MPEKLEVWLHVDFLGSPCLVGRLSHDRGQVWFNYEESWLKNPDCFSIDPDLSLDAARFFPKPERENFGVFLDSSPDRWGQTLMERRELLDAKSSGRTPRKLYAWDYLLGVQDETRQGALRFRREGEDAFLAADLHTVPPITSLAELEAVAFELSNKRINDLSALHKWLSVLVSPGSSLGGARPKANFRETDGSLWIAKFPAHDDTRDVGAWEWVAHVLSKAAGIDVPPAKKLKLGSHHHTFCVKRFDRNKAQRVFYSSAKTVLGKGNDDYASYLEIAGFLSSHGAQGTVKQGLEQLFRRVAFNVVIGNKDDHLKNHGFLLQPSGWVIAPAFDVNPNPDKREHVLAIDEANNQPDLETVLQTSEWYELTRPKAERIVEEIVKAIKKWPAVAKKAGIPNAEIELMRDVFYSG